MKEITIDVSQLFDHTDSAKLQDLPTYLEQVSRIAGTGNRIVLTGRGPIWLYLKIAHELHGTAASLDYDSPVTGRVSIFDHNPF